MLTYTQHKYIKKKRYITRNNERYDKFDYIDRFIDDQNDIFNEIDDPIYKFIKILPNELIKKIYMMVMCKYHNRHILDKTYINCICCNKHIEHFHDDIYVILEPYENKNKMIGFMKRISNKNIFMCSPIFPSIPIKLINIDHQQYDMFYDMNIAIKEKYNFDHFGPLFIDNNNPYITVANYIVAMEKIKLKPLDPENYNFIDKYNPERIQESVSKIFRDPYIPND